MKRFFLSTLLLCLLAPLAMAKPTTIRIASIAPDGTGWMKIMREAADEIKVKTDDRVRIRYFPGGVQGSDKTVLRKIQTRQLQGGAVSSGSLTTLSLMTQLYSLPFTFNNLDEIRAARVKFDPIIEQGLADSGFTLLGMSEGGFAYIMSNGALQGKDDFKSKKVWVPEGDLISQTTFKNGGVEPISLPISDVYTSLQTGLIDTIGANASSVVALQWHGKLKQAADYPLIFLFGMLVVDSRVLNGLSDEDKATVKEVMRAAFLRMDKQNEQDEIAARQALINNGVEFVQLHPQTQQGWRKMAGDSLSTLAEQNVYPVDVYQELIQFLEEYRAKAK